MSPRPPTGSTSWLRRWGGAKSLADRGGNCHWLCLGVFSNRKPRKLFFSEQRLAVGLAQETEGARAHVVSQGPCSGSSERLQHSGA